MLDYGLINNIGIAVFGLNNYSQYQLVITGVGAVLILWAFLWIFGRMTRKEPPGLTQLWSKPPAREGKEFMKMREDEQNKF